MKRLAVFASGSGTNAENIIRYFKNSSEVEICLILSNKPDAFVLERAKQLNVPTFIFNRKDFYQTNTVLEALKAEEVDYIILAGFLWLVPDPIVQAYPAEILNIHPALLPKFGGKGMYGHHVHRAVIDTKEKESGITIHLIDGEYDKGQNLFQTTCPVFETDTPDSLADRIHKLEYEHFPKVIEQYIKSRD